MKNINLKYVKIAVIVLAVLCLAFGALILFVSKPEFPDSMKDWDIDNLELTVDKTEDKVFRIAFSGILPETFNEFALKSPDGTWYEFRNGDSSVEIKDDVIILNVKNAAAGKWILAYEYKFYDKISVSVAVKSADDPKSVPSGSIG